MGTILQLALFLLVLTAVVSILAYTLVTGISPYPTSRTVRQTMIRGLPSDLRGTVLELGSGWGGLLLAIARHLPHCTVEGYERSPVPWLVSRLRVALAGLSNVRVRRADFFSNRLPPASAVVCFLYTGAMERLGPKLKEELEEGALVISNTFSIPSWIPAQETRVEDLYGTRVYSYRVPEPDAGGVRRAGSKSGSNT